MRDKFLQYVKNFDDFGLKTVEKEIELVLNNSSSKKNYTAYTNEFWTSKQRQSHSIHEISYRACFKAQLPEFFINKLSNLGDIVYDPFSGRGTTGLQSFIMGRVPYVCDINPLSKILLEPRLHLTSFEKISQRVDEIDLSDKHHEKIKTDKFLSSLLNFFHIDTLSDILCLKEYFKNKTDKDNIDDWIMMVATNRLTGHSKGFFSVYTLPPNQSVSVNSQIKINQKLNQTPEHKNIKEIIKKKSKSLLRDYLKKNIKDKKLKLNKDNRMILVKSCQSTPEISSNSVSLIVTSPPFLDVVNYKSDNWLRAWFNDIEIDSIKVWQIRNKDDWSNHMGKVFVEFERILKPGGFIAFEVGEINSGKLNMEDLVIPLGLKAKLHLVCLLVNKQNFTKTSNLWGVDNLKKGTNSNRVIIFQK